MNWLPMNPQYLDPFARLGVQRGSAYHAEDDCLDSLNDILVKIRSEDRTLRTVRRAMGIAQVVKKDLLPLLIGVKSDANIVDVTIKILLNLTLPVECLVPIEEMLRNATGRVTVDEINVLLTSSKEAFSPPQSTSPILHHMKIMLEKEGKLTADNCESIANCLLLLRNILHIPEERPTGGRVSVQNQILWNLFAQNVDKVLIKLMTSKHQVHWGVSMVQLMAVMYKDLQVSNLQKLLNSWVESSVSDSSEESNTSPQHQASVDSSPLLTSDPASDSSDNEGSNKKTNSYYNAGDCKCMNNESDDSQSSEPAASSSTVPPSAGSSTDSGHQTGPDNHPMTKIKNMLKLQSSPCCVEKNGKADSSVAEDSLLTFDGQSESWSQHSITKSSSAPSTSFTPAQPQGPFSAQGKYQGRSSDSYENFQGDGLRKDSHPKSHCPHGPPNSEGNLPKTSGGKVGSGSDNSDYGYATQQDNRESNSTSSNEEDTPPLCMKRQKPHHMIQKSRCAIGKHNITPQERRKLHYKKLAKRRDTKYQHLEEILEHIPSDNDVSNLLKDFTVDFLLQGYACLVKVVHNCILDSRLVSLDSSHFFWLVTYFLKFAVQLELDLEPISNSVLTVDIVSYLVYEGVQLHEELQMNSKCPGADIKSCLRRMHLVVTSIREFIHAVESYKKITHLTEEDQNHLSSLQSQIAAMQDLRGLFVLLLRHYNPSLQSRQFLQDLVVTNHNILIFVESSVSRSQEFKTNFNLSGHVKQFATVEVMQNYGLLLEDFQNNGKFVNDCVLTMMHHVAGELCQVSVLFQPKILCALSEIWESDYELCDDWSDLVEYVVYKFARNHPQKKKSLSSIAKSQQATPSFLSNITEWTNEDSKNLYWYYRQCCGLKDPIHGIVKKFKKSGVHGKTRISIIQQLLQQDCINENEYKFFMEKETLLAVSEKRRSSVCAIQTSAMLEEVTRKSQVEQIKEMKQDKMEFTNNLCALKDMLKNDGYGKMIMWLQQHLLEMSCVKLSLERDLPMLKEPIPHLYARLQQSTPLVPWYADQEQCLQHPTFILLLHKLGIHLAGDAGKLFPRIPHFWTTDVLYNTAEKLGPISEGKLKFDVNMLVNNDVAPRLLQEMDISASSSLLNNDFSNAQGFSNSRNSFFIPPTVSQSTLSLRGYGPEPVMSNMPNWLQVVQQSKATSQSASGVEEVGCGPDKSIFSAFLTSGAFLPINKESSSEDVENKLNSSASNPFQYQHNTNEEQTEMDTST